MYVPEEGVRQTLRAIASQSAPGSSILMDFTTKEAVEFMKRHPQRGPANVLEAWNESWVFGISEGAVEEFFTELGLETELFSFTSPEAIKRYLTQSDGTIFGMRSSAQNRGPRYRLAELRVPLRT